jgi:NAD(P)-dependent dehydrogenase (short-subunit alcohol dehydrogenase family)
MAPGLAIITGATGGLGYEAALGLARAGMTVLMTGRDAGRGADALARARQAAPGASLDFALLDVSSLASVAAFASAVAGPIAVLVNNAGIMALPKRQTTIDGFEQQLGTNYLGHFALTGRLLPHLRGGRVVNVASVAHRRGAIAFDDLQSERAYAPFAAYAQSKLAMLMFGLELERRSQAEGWGVAGYAAHPGWSATRIVVNGIGQKRPGLLTHALQAGFNLLGQSAAAGALPILYAALDPAAKPGGYYGPCCWGETRGHPTESKIYPQAANPADCARLWNAAEALTQVRYGAGTEPAPHLAAG